MSELINKYDSRATIRWKLLASASAAALIVTAAGSGSALAADSDVSSAHLWIELGTQLERVSGGDPAFAPPFYSRVAAPIDSPAKIVSELPWSLGPDGKITFQPAESDWQFSAGIRFGRSKSHRSTHQASRPPQATNVLKYVLQHYYSPGGNYYYFKIKCCQTSKVTPDPNYADVQSLHQESHVILDFQAGKDVGLGLFGPQSTSTLSAGVRIAQFKTRSNISVKARTDMHHYDQFSLPTFASFKSGFPQKYELATNHRQFSLTAASERSFKGFGPSISWEASAAIAGNPDTSQLTFDWGLNAAVLFGKQKSRTNHQSSGSYQKGKYHNLVSSYAHPLKHYTRSRNVTVPNVGGTAGFSIKWPNAKISVGYRADVFFKAMDSGWDAAKKEDRGFYGPFATISFGLGD